VTMGWEAVIGIEIHVQLRTERKLFCGDRTEFGAPPNTRVCPVCLGLPGALPTVNPEAVRLAVLTAMALGCDLAERSVWARKNYFYPDLPKGYQISQFEEPLAAGGVLRFESPQGREEEVRIRRVHMEEDAGKLVHDRFPGRTAVDLNRAGTPLVEIVTEPDLHSPEDTRAFLVQLKQILEYLEVSDCNMEEGSLRADANVSLRRVGAKELGRKTEVKNVNSFSGIERALEIEIARQRETLEAGGVVEQQTLIWDDHRGVVRPMRSKEESHDYRYFPEPDLPPLVVRTEQIESVRKILPELPLARRDRLAETLGLSRYDAGVLTQSRRTADYFEEVAAGCGDAKLAANWVMGPVQAATKAHGEDRTLQMLAPDRLVALLRLVREDVVSEAAGKKVMARMLKESTAPEDIVEREGLAQIRDAGQLDVWIRSVLEEHPGEAQRCRDGETRLLGFFVGRVMARSGGRADPKRVNEALRRALVESRASKVRDPPWDGLRRRRTDRSKRGAIPSREGRPAPHRGMEGGASCVHCSRT